MCLTGSDYQGGDDSDSMELSTARAESLRLRSNLMSQQNCKLSRKTPTVKARRLLTTWLMKMGLLSCRESPWPQNDCINDRSAPCGLRAREQIDEVG